MSNMIANALSGLASRAIGGGNQEVVNTAVQLFNTLKGDANYVKTLRSMASTNKQVADALQFIDQNGGNPDNAFYKLAEKAGIDPNTILNILK